MDIYEVIRQRRSIKNFTAEPVPPPLLMKVLETAIWAQNHGMTQPWRFTILGPETRGNLALAHEAQRQKFEHSQPIVVVSNVLAADAVVRREDYGATSCAIQNIALTAWTEGLGMVWGSGKTTSHQKTYSVLGIDPEREEIVAFLTFGFPVSMPAAPPRKPLAEVLKTLP